MRLRSLLLALVTGFAGFMLATVAVTAALEPRVEFSILVGLPVGIVTGLVLVWFVYSRSTQANRTAGERRVANALSAAGVSFVLVFAVAATLGAGVTIALAIAVLVAAIAGVGMHQRGPPTP